ncbi:MAG: glycerol-3-phosphate 1-O-acyltransferase PlsY [Acidobacteriota bacterium]|nr:glycerol-3-phosphate 1-O-acyltransferase PlsY [Acidobacteriota bacterium]
MIVEWFLVLAAYLIGSVPFAYVVPRAFAGVDVRLSGSRNVGAANVLRTTRLGIALLVVCLDVAKGAAAVALARAAGADAGILAAAAAASIVGHVYPVWLRLRGGKGVAVACGAFVVLAPAATVICVAVFAGVVWVSGYISLGSVISTAVLAPFTMVFDNPVPVTVSAAGVAALILFRHRANIARIAAGTERRIGQKA